MQIRATSFSLPYKLIALLVALFLILAVANPAHAESINQSQVDAPQTSTPQTFEYIARRSNNLTLLVRRSLQLHDESNDQINLSEAQVIYAETNIVRQLGSFQLDVGQEVSVPIDLVKQFAQSSQSLTERETAAWNKYARRADFSLSDIQPVNADDAALQTDDKSTDLSANEQQQAGQNQAQSQQGSQDGGTDWWWFASLAGVLLVLWYIFRQRNDTE